MSATNHSPEQLDQIHEILKSIRYDVWNLMGDYHKRNRQVFMTLLKNSNKKIPIAKSGVFALIAELKQLIGLNEDTYDEMGYTCEACFCDILKKYFTQH